MQNMIENAVKSLILLSFLFSFSYAQNVIDSPELLYEIPLVENMPLAQKVTVSWKFNSINDFVNVLQKNYAINSQIVSNAEIPSSMILVYINNGTLAELITQAGNKFGYTWSYKDGVVIFRAIHPLTASKNLMRVTQMAWNLAPADKTLRAALSRWCKIANWQLIWNVHADYLITTSWRINGSFETAINEVLKASQETDVPLIAIMHDSNYVLEISSLTTSAK